jgi:hypothetical protein
MYINTLVDMGGRAGDRNDARVNKEVASLITHVTVARGFAGLRARAKANRMEVNLETMALMSVFITRQVKLAQESTIEDPRWLRKTHAKQQAVPDGGVQAWLRVFGYFLVCMSTLGLQYAFSALYPALLQALKAGPTATALVGSLCAGTMEGFAVPAALVISRYGARTACLLGCALSVLGLLCSAACTSVWQLILAYGLLTGLGHSLAFFAPIVLMARWFSSKLALA